MAAAVSVSTCRHEGMWTAVRGMLEAGVILPKDCRLLQSFGLGVIYQGPDSI